MNTFVTQTKDKMNTTSRPPPQESGHCSLAACSQLHPASPRLSPTEGTRLESVLRIPLLCSYSYATHPVTLN